MSQTGAELSHLVHLVDTLAGQEVQSVQILLVAGEQQAAVGLFDRDDGLENGALAVLNPLTHGVQVGSEVARSREDTLLVLALALAVELFPPLREEVELGLVVDHDLNLLAGSIETVADSGILGCHILFEGNILSTALLHLGSTGNELLDVETGTGYGKQTDGSEHREASTHVVGDDKRLVTLLVGTRAGSTALSVCDSHDDLLGHLLAHLCLTLLFQQAEGQGGLSGSARLGDVDDTELLVLQILRHLAQVVLTDIVACKQDDGVLLALDEPCKRIAQGLNDCAGTQIGAADACYYHYFALLAQSLGCCLHLVEELGSDAAGQMQPS